MGSILAGFGAQKSALVSILVLLMLTTTCFVVGGRRVTLLAISITLRAMFVTLFIPVIAVSICAAVIFVALVGMIIEVTRDLGYRFIVEEINVDKRKASLVLGAQLIFVSGVIWAGSMFF